MDEKLRQDAHRAILELDKAEKALRDVSGTQGEGEALSIGLTELPEKLYTLGQKLADVDNEKDQLEANLKFMFQSLKHDYMKGRDDLQGAGAMSATRAEAKAELDPDYQNAKAELIEIKKAHAYLKVRLDAGQKFFEACRSRLSWLNTDRRNA